MKSIFNRVLITLVAITICAVVIISISTGLVTFGHRGVNQNMDASSLNAMNNQPQTGTIQEDTLIYVLPNEQMPVKEEGKRRIVKHIHYNYNSMQWIQRNLYSQIADDHSVNTETEIIVKLEDSPITVGDGNNIVNDNLNDNEVDVAVDQSVNDSGNTDTDINIEKTEDNDVVDVDVAPVTPTPEVDPNETATPAPAPEVTEESTTPVE
jgi:hypothetical protein